MCRCGKILWSLTAVNMQKKNSINHVKPLRTNIHKHVKDKLFSLVSIHSSKIIWENLLKDQSTFPLNITVNSHDQFTWWCIDFVRRELMLTIMPGTWRVNAWMEKGVKSAKILLNYRVAWNFSGFSFLLFQRYAKKVPTNKNYHKHFSCKNLLQSKYSLT